MRILASLAVLLFGVTTLTAGTVELFTWYSPSRDDYFTTSNPLWAGGPGDTRSPDYRFVRREGRVFEPTAAQPPDTRPLYSWWSAERGDNFITSDLRWRGTPGAVREGYAFARLEGYAFVRELADTVPLTAWWNRGAGDNRATTDPRFSVFNPPPWYTGGGALGYVIAVERDELHSAFGFDSMRVNGRPAAGDRPLLVLLIEFSDLRFVQTTNATATQQFFGPGFPNIRDYYAEMSEGRFRWRNAGVIGPLVPADLPGTSENESTQAVASRDEGKPMIARVLASLIRTRQIDPLWRDSNGDGTVTQDELSIAVIVAGWSGATRPMVPDRVSVDGSPAITSWVSITGEENSFATLAHELGHLLGADDLYGSIYHSLDLTLMGGTWGGGDDRRVWYLDPWHRIQLGWITPRIVETSRSGGVARLAAVASRATPAYHRRPLLFSDPRRGTTEYFLVEYRTNQPAAQYDANVWDGARGHGMVVWQVKTDDRGKPLVVTGALIAAGPNGTLESRLAGNDVHADSNEDGRFDQILGGPNRVLESTAAGDDELRKDPVVWALGPSSERGRSYLFRNEDGPLTANLLRVNPIAWDAAALVIAAGPATAAAQAIDVQWGFDFLPRLDSAPPSVSAGSTVTLAGAFPATPPAALRVRIADDDAGTFVLPITEWSAGSVTVSVPRNVPAATYTLEVWSDAVGRLRSNWRALAVSPAR